MFGKIDIAPLPDWIAELSAPSDTKLVQTTNSGKISEGQRNSSLTSYAGSMRQRGLPADEIEERLIAINEKQCSPPLPVAEVRSIATSIMRYDASSREVVEMTLNDVGNADRFVTAVSGEMRYVATWGSYISWIGTRWKRIDLGEAMERAKAVIRQIEVEAEAQTDLDIRRALRAHATRSLNQPRLRAACDLARNDPRLRIEHTKCDAKALAIAAKNGLIDLKTGKLRKHRRSYYITRVVPVKFDPDARCPLFKRFLLDIAGGDKAYFGFIVRLLGYLLTGSTAEQKFFFLYGTGANGKSTFLAVIRELLGPDFVAALPPDTLMFKPRGRSATNDLARLDGTRVVISNEIEEGCQFDEQLIKAITGNDTITARYLYKEFVDFVPQFKLLIAGNHQPIIKGDDYAIWRRVLLLPFTVTIPENKRDPHLLEKLRKELPGILALAIRGCLRWQEYGLETPNAVVKASTSYRKEMDLLGRWIDERAKVSDDQKWLAIDAYRNYHGWCQMNGFAPMSNAVFGRKLKSRYQSKRTSRGIIYLKIGSRVVSDDNPEDLRGKLTNGAAIKRKVH